MTGEYFLSITDLSKKLCVSDSYIYEEINAGRFPLPVQMGGRSRWSGLEVEAWMEVVKNQPRALRKSPAPKARRAAPSQQSEAVPQTANQ